jgi:excisionase family DNA binding protein
MNLNLNLSDWPSETEAARQLGVSWRTLIRRCEAGELERQMRPRPGKKPEPVINPRDVERLLAKKPMVMRSDMVPSPAPGQETAVVPVFAAVLDRLAGVLEKFAPAARRAPASDWMTPAEAGRYVGLSEGLIRRLIRTGKLPFLREKRGFVVARVHLDNLDALAGLAGLQQATIDLRQTVASRRAAQ